MTDIAGVKIVDFTESGSSDDGEHIWITHRLDDGSEYPLVYPYQAIGYLLTALSDAARSGFRRRSARNPQEAAAGMDSNVIPVDEIRVGTAPDRSGAILHFVALEVPAHLLADVVEQLRRAHDRVGGLPASVTKRLH